MRPVLPIAASKPIYLVRKDWFWWHRLCVEIKSKKYSRLFIAPFVALYDKDWIASFWGKTDISLSKGFWYTSILVAWPLSGTVDWRVWALTSTSVHLLILLVCFVLVCCDKWPSFHHRRIKSLNLGARIRIKQVVVEHVICISQQEERLWHYQVNCPSRWSLSLIFGFL